MKVIITGSTGMVGKGVLLECMDDSRVSEILLINRHPIDLSHPKIKEVIHQDFTSFSTIAQELKGYDACYHCMGISSIGVSDEKYKKVTYDMSKALADTLYELNPDMVMTYVSGTGTDSSESSSTMWKRVKGKTENMIFDIGFKDAYAFRPGAIIPERGIKSSTGWYNAIYVISRPIFPLLKKVNSITTTTKLGKAMINCVTHPQELKVLEGSDINELSMRHLN